MSRTNINQSFAPPPEQRVTRSQRIIHKGAGLPYDTTTSEIITFPAVCLLRRDSFVTPNYPEAKATGTLKPLTFEFKDWYWHPSNGVKQTTTREVLGRNTTITTITGNISHIQSASAVNAGPSSARIFNLVNSCKQKALLKLKDQDINLAQTIAERQQTIDMIRNNINRIGSCYSALKAGNYGAAANALGVKLPQGGSGGKSKNSQLDAVSNGWLELQYGWRPLISDVYGGAKFLHKSFTSPRTKLIRASATEKLTNEEFSSTPITAGEKRYHREYEVDVLVNIYYRRNNSTLATLKELGITNPLYLAYELTRYSFVVDWFIHIGMFLSSLDASFGCTFDSGHYTTGVRRSETIHTYQNGAATSYVDYKNDFHEKHETFDLDRVILTTFPVLTLPAFQDPRSVTHTLNAIALLNQSSKR